MPSDLEGDVVVAATGAIGVDGQGQLEQVAEVAVAAHQRLAVAVLDDPSLVEHHDLVDEVAASTAGGR